MREQRKSFPCSATLILSVVSVEYLTVLYCILEGFTPCPYEVSMPRPAYETSSDVHILAPEYGYLVHTFD